MKMMSHTKSARINLRTSPEAKALIERAAAIMGATVSSFILQNACEAARQDFEQFLKLVPDAPAQAGNELPSDK